MRLSGEGAQLMCQRAKIFSLRRIFVCVSASLLGARIATHVSPDGREESKEAPPRARAILVFFSFFLFFFCRGA